MISSSRVAIIVPCLNEAETVGRVIEEFGRAAPEARIVVIDNGSTDQTATVARALGVTVISEPRRGKGQALRRAFRDVDADVFVLADGDDQAPADRVDALVSPILEDRADLVVGSRTLGADHGSRLLNRLGNWAFSALLRGFLHVPLTDVLSGYRAIRRSAVQQLTLRSVGFEIEVELTIRAAQAHQRVLEVPIDARPRAAGNRPRLRAFRDGFAILAAVCALLAHCRPLRFIALPGLVLFAVSVGFALTVLATSGGSGGPAILAVVLDGLVAAAGLALLALGVGLVPTARLLGRDDRSELAATRP